MASKCTFEASTLRRSALVGTSTASASAAQSADESKDEGKRKARAECRSYHEPCVVKTWSWWSFLSCVVSSAVVSFLSQVIGRKFARETSSRG